MFFSSIQCTFRIERNIIKYKINKNKFIFVFNYRELVEDFLIDVHTHTHMCFHCLLGDR